VIANPPGICSRCNTPLHNGRCPKATPETMEDTIDRLTTERDALKAELERWRHGNTIEGDFVCPDSLALTEVTAERDRMRPVYEAAKALKDEDLMWSGEMGNGIRAEPASLGDLVVKFYDAIDAAPTRKEQKT
jgi:hypothetical protein